MSEIIKFKFPEAVDTEIIENQLALAIVATECTFGQPKVRVNAAYYLSKDKPAVVIDVSTEVGEHIAQLFTGLMIRQLGEDKFTLERIQHEGKQKDTVLNEQI
jgi:hypothetical protein